MICQWILDQFSWICTWSNPTWSNPTIWTTTVSFSDRRRGKKHLFRQRRAPESADNIARKLVAVISADVKIDNFRKIRTLFWLAAGKCLRAFVAKAAPGDIREVFYSLQKPGRAWENTESEIHYFYQPYNQPCFFGCIHLKLLISFTRIRRLYIDRCSPLKLIKSLTKCSAIAKVYKTLSF